MEPVLNNPEGDGLEPEAVLSTGDRLRTAWWVKAILALALVAVGLTVLLPLAATISGAGILAVLFGTSTVLSQVGGLARSTFHAAAIVGMTLAGVTLLLHLTARPLLARRQRLSDDEASGILTTFRRHGLIGVYLRAPVPLLVILVLLLGTPLVLLEWGATRTCPTCCRPDPCFCFLC